MKRASIVRQDPAIQKMLSIFPYSLNLYMDYPQQEISLLDFETYGLDRLQQLRAVENAYVRSITNTSDLVQISKKYMPVNPNSDNFKDTNPKKYSEEIQERYLQRLKDYTSHFVLRLAYCQTEDLREWFIKQESSLLQMRWNNPLLSNEEKSSFINSLNLNMEEVSSKEKRELENELRSVIRIQDNTVKNEDRMQAELSKKYYKLPFEDVVDLVQSRSVYLRKGMAYIREEEIISLIVHIFKENLRNSLERLSSIYTKLLREDEERIGPVLTNISRQYIDDDYSGKVDENITHKDIPRLSKYFPLCMRHLQDQLQIDSHLRHGGRMQYGLFLKGIGMSLQESLLFWKIAFSKKFTEDQFNKKYAYNIRYNYGQEGKRTDYRPYSCAKIIMTNPPSTGDHHGCPFRHASLDTLSKMLKHSGVRENRISEICSYAKEGHYQLACTRMLEILTGADNGERLTENITHPNKYFEQCYPGSEYNQKNKLPDTNNHDDFMDI